MMTSEQELKFVSEYLYDTIISDYEYIPRTEDEKIASDIIKNHKLNDVGLKDYIIFL